MKGARLILAAWMMAAIATAVWAEPGPRAGTDFVDQVRMLMLMQDSAAQGNHAAPALEKQIITVIVADIGAGKVPQAEDARQANAVLCLVLSGGPPSIAEELLKTKKLPPLQAVLLEGAVKFKRGDIKAAGRLLLGLDATRLPQTIGGRVALMQAMLVPDAEPARRQEYLALAMALAPGTLVEDAALRRAALLAVQTPDIPLMWRRAERYFSRMPQSLYARPFTMQLLAQLSGQIGKGDGIDTLKLERLLNGLPRDDRTLTYVEMARQATASSRGDLARFAAARARRLAPEGSYPWQRAQLYDAAWSVADGDADRLEARLRTISPEALDAQGVLLLNLVKAVSARIHDAAPAAGDVPAADEAGTTMPGDLKVLTDRAATALAEAQSLLKKTP